MRAALVHDIGIKVAEEKYGSSDGKLQEKEGPAGGPADADGDRLSAGGCGSRVLLVGHHHTYLDMDGMDYQILVEGDFPRKSV